MVSNHIREWFPVLTVVFSTWMIIKLPGWIANFCYGPIRPAPKLPYTVYWPTYTSIYNILLGLMVATFGYFVDQAAIGAALMGLGIFLIIGQTIRIIKPRKVVEISTEGLRSKFTGIWKAKRDFIAWHEILRLQSFSINAGRSTISCIRIALHNGEELDFAMSLKYKAKKELVIWLEEYLSRYGSNVKHATATE